MFIVEQNGAATFYELGETDSSLSGRGDEAGIRDKVQGRGDDSNRSPPYVQTSGLKTNPWDHKASAL